MARCRQNTVAETQTMTTLLRHAALAPLLLGLALLSACSPWRTIPWPERVLLWLEEAW